jgi:hypothetical protein
LALNSNKLCEFVSGYCYSLKIYVGNNNKNSEVNSSEAVVIDLLKPIINNGHTLFLDNWYSSSKLFYYLSRNGTNACGIVRQNRKNMLAFFERKKLNSGIFSEKLQRITFI